MPNPRRAGSRRGRGYRPRSVVLAYPAAAGGGARAARVRHSMLLLRSMDWGHCAVLSVTRSSCSGSSGAAGPARRADHGNEPTVQRPADGDVFSTRHSHRALAKLVGAFPVLVLAREAAYAGSAGSGSPMCRMRSSASVPCSVRSEMRRCPVDWTGHREPPRCGRKVSRADRESRWMFHTAPLAVMVRVYGVILLLAALRCGQGPGQMGTGHASGARVVSASATDHARAGT